MIRTLIVMAGLVLSIASSAQQVVLYRDCNFRGTSVAVGPGNYMASQLGILVNQLSSVNIPSGYVVNLFSQDQFGGHYISLNSSSSCLVNQGFNDKTVSLQVIYLGPGYVSNAPPVRVYRLCNFIGRAEDVYEGTYNNYTSNFNGILSIRVSPGYAVLFRRESRMGNTVTTVTEEYRNDKTCLPITWGGSVKDAYVYRLDNVYDGYWNNNPGSYTNFTQGAVAYSDLNFRGRAQALHVGAFRNYQLGQVGDMNISSVMVAPGYRILAFSGPDFDGASNVFSNSVNNLHALPVNWGNRIRSVIVERIGQPNPGNVVITNPPVNPGGVVITNPPVNPGGVVITNPPTGSYAQIPPGTPTNMVTVYSGSYFTGGKWSFQPGRYRSSQLLGVGSRNISSLVVPPGYRVIAYTGTDFNGSSRVIDATIHDLQAEGAGWNKAIASMVVERMDPGYVNTGNPGSVTITNPGYVNTGNTGSVTITNPGSVNVGNQPNRPMPAGAADMIVAYVDANYSGSAQSFTPGRYSAAQLSGTPPRTISSIRIPPGHKVTVYDGPNFDGDYRVLTYSIDNFVTEGQGRWNDRISSMVIEKM